MKPEEGQQKIGVNYSKLSDSKKADYNFLKKNLDDYPDNIQILDVGTGKDPFRDLTRRFENLVTLDFSPFETVKIVHDFNKGLPFEDNKFDCVILANTLEHSAKPGFLLKEISRVLKKRTGKIIGVVPFLLQIHQEPYDFYRYTRYGLEKLLKENGFDHITIEELGNPFFIYRNFQGFFFWNLLHTELHKNPLLNSLAMFTIKIIWFTQKCLLKILSPIYKKCKKDEKVVQGYGFIGQKTS